MSRPKARRCEICLAVTARYRRTVRQGAVKFRVWDVDARYGEQLTENGAVVRCGKHAVAPR